MTTTEPENQPQQPPTPDPNQQPAEGQPGNEPKGPTEEEQKASDETQDAMESLPEGATESELKAAQADVEGLPSVEEVADSVLTEQAGSNRATREWAATDAGKKYHEEEVPEIEKRQEEAAKAYDEQLNSGKQLRS